MGTASASDYGYLRELVLTYSQNLLDPSCDYLFDSRLTRVMRDQGVTQIDELVQLLRRQRDAALEQAIAQAMTINETSFFRDVHPFELLRSELLPKLIESRRETRTLRFWSAACSTGQEAYSLAMLLRDSFPGLAAWDVRIEGTDLCEKMVERARAGAYSRIEMNRGLPARCIVRYFDRAGEDWIIKPEIRRLCNFRQANLAGPRLPFSRATDRFDLVLLRNVMLYFSQETRKSLLAGIHHLLLPDGILMLGASEQAAEPSLWQSFLACGACYYKPRMMSQAVPR